MGTTAHRAFRYPAGTDRVTDGATAIQHLAEDVDTVLVGAAKFHTETATVKIGGGNTYIDGVTIPTGDASVVQVTQTDGFNNRVPKVVSAWISNNGASGAAVVYLNGSGLAAGNVVTLNTVGAL